MTLSQHPLPKLERSRAPHWTAFLLVVFFAVPAKSQEPADRIEKLAASGQIDENVPVKASAQMAIHASPEKVWRVLTDIDKWPTWYTTISRAKINGTLEPGTTFLWKEGRSKITSRIALVHPGSQLVWTGTTFGARGIHLWNLESLPDGSTLVKTRESLSGFLLRLKVFYSSKDLAGQLKEWLEALKRKVEE